VVYDGGGIVPDIKIEPQYVSRFALVLYTMGYLEDWADEYVRKHPDLKIDVRTFSISDEDYADFTAFISEKDVPYESETRLALKKLEEAIKNDLYDETLGDALESMRSQIKDDKLSNMKTYRSEIIDALNSEIILRYAYNSGALEYSIVKNSTVQQANDLLLDTAEYRRILREQSPEKR
jgi:carboxyl-terminal processing protease